MSQSPVIDLLSPPASELARLDAQFPARDVALGEGAVVSVRECGTGPAMVCLHGIGSGAASWLDVAAELSTQAHVIAWDAPGYGSSTPVAPAQPKAGDYAQRLGALLDALNVERCVLVGHSLGALTAAAAARRGSPLAQRIAQLVLISPARGYGAPAQHEQANKVRAERIDTLESLGIAGMAAQRSGRLLSDGAGELSRQWVRWNMARLNDGGYRQAVELLCGDDLLGYLPPAVAVRVLCGEHDVVTTPAQCRQVADACGVPLEPIANAGHASYVEQPAAVAAALAQSLGKEFQ
jgi:pimeloyl-ACP methyl ester carboxylesterase